MTEGLSMKVVWLSHIIPFPPQGGAAQRGYYLIRSLASRAEIHLVAFHAGGANQSSLDEVRHELLRYCASVRFFSPAFRRASARWWWELGTVPFRRQPLSSRGFSSRTIVAAWRKYLASQPDALLHCDTPEMSALLAEAAGRARVLTHHNCESHLAARRAAAESHPVRRFYLRMESARLARLERGLCHRCDVNVVVSKTDGLRLLEVNPHAHVHVVENGVETISPPAAKEVETSPPEVLFTGVLDWEPNITAVEFFLRRVWPRIRQAIPEARFVVAGRNPSVALQKRTAGVPGVALVPNPEQMRNWFERATVFACPLQTGGGTRIKILEAMAAGTAVVSTTVGCEGLEVCPGEHLLVADEPAAFADAVLQLLRDRALRQRLGSAGRTQAEQRYQWRHLSERLWNAWECAAGRTSCRAGALLSQSPPLVAKV